MRKKTQIQTGPIYRAKGKRRNYTGDDGVEYVGPPEASSGSGNFWTNGGFTNILSGVGGFFSNVAGGVSSIINSKNTTTTNMNNQYAAQKNTGLWLGIGIVAVVLVLVLAFAFNKR